MPIRWAGCALLVFGLGLLAARRVAAVLLVTAYPLILFGLG